VAGINGGPQGASDPLSDLHNSQLSCWSKRWSGLDASNTWDLFLAWDSYLVIERKFELSKFMLKKSKKTNIFLKTRKKENLKRDCECSTSPWIDNEYSCNVLKAFVPYMRQNSLEMTSTHILAVLIWKAQLWCSPSAESPRRLCCNKPQQQVH